MAGVRRGIALVPRCHMDNSCFSGVMSAHLFLSALRRVMGTSFQNAGRIDMSEWSFRALQLLEVWLLQAFGMALNCMAAGLQRWP